MGHRTAAWLAWSLCAGCFALIVLALSLDFLTGAVPLPPELRGLRPGLGFALLTGVLSLAFPTVGALIASRLPTNPIGWIFCGMGLLLTGQRFSTSYADYALLENFAFPVGEFMAWLSGCVWFGGLTLGVFLILLFPDGRLPSRRWRIVAWAAVFGAALSTLGFGFMSDYLFLTHPYVQNPFGVIGVIGGGFTTYELFGASRFLGMVLLLTSSLAALLSFLLRLHHARGNERQQITWFLFAAVPLTLFLGLIELNILIANLTFDFMLKTVYILPSSNAFTAVLYVQGFGLLFIPIFTYISILKYRLYNIDVVINRTLVYGSLTVTLVALYLGGIVVLQRLFVLLTGQQSTLAVVASTLLIAALFNPLRRRIQSFIDRRFYRRKYDARKTLEAFSATLRDETDLEALRVGLVGVVRETMQPEHVSLWLRPDTPRNGTRVG
jgi:hypothetical protein